MLPVCAYFWHHIFCWDLHGVVTCLNRCCQLLRRYSASLVNFVWFTDDKLLKFHRCSHKKPSKRSRWRACLDSWTFTLSSKTVHRHTELARRLSFWLTRSLTLYEGRSINKLQNGAIPLILKIWKIRNIRFVGNLILNMQKYFLDDDVIIVTSSVHRTQSICVLFSPPVITHNS